MTRRRENVVDQLTETFVLRIVRRELVPGGRLPSVRALAEEHGVNVSTLQRVLVRLEEMRAVEVRARSGVVVLDPARHGGAALFPIILRHANAHAKLATTILSDALSARRSLAVQVVSDLAAVPFERYAAPLAGSIDEFAAVIAADPRELVAIARAESEITRTVLIASQRPAVLAIYNDIEAMLRTSPSVLQALCGNADAALLGWRTFARMLERGQGVASTSYVEAFLAAQDESIVQRFARALAGAPSRTERAVRGATKRRPSVSKPASKRRSP